MNYFHNIKVIFVKCLKYYFYKASQIFVSAFIISPPPKAKNELWKRMYKKYLLPDLQTSGVISSSGCSMLNIVGKGSLVISKQIINTR